MFGLHTPCGGICLTPRGGNRRPFRGHWVSLVLAPIHPRVCGEQDRDQYSRMAEDGSSPVPESSEVPGYLIKYCK